MQPAAISFSLFLIVSAHARSNACALVQDPKTAESVFKEVEKALTSLPRPKSGAERTKHEAAVTAIVTKALADHDDLFDADEDGESWKVKLTALMTFPATETFDILTYAPLKGWKKDARAGIVNFTQILATTGGFCVVAMYASAASTGEAQKDFDRDWKELVATPFQARKKPRVIARTNPDGWRVLAGTLPVEQDGIELKVKLTVFSGFGKSLAIRTSFNDESLVQEVDAMLETMSLDTPAPREQRSSDKFRSTSGKPAKFGAITYLVPEGWGHQQFSDGVVLKPLDLPPNEGLAVQIMSPLMNAESLNAALEQTYDEAVTMYKATKMNEPSGGNYSKQAARRSFQGWEYIRCSGGIQVENGTPYKDEYGLDLFVVKIHDRYERVVVLKSRKNCGTSRYYPTERLSYRNAIEGLLFSMTFADWKQAGLAPGSTQGPGILGVWQGISLSTSAAVGIRYDVFSPIFLDNGQAYYGPHFPSTGLEGFDTRIAAENHQRDWGTYSFSNGKGVLKMPYGDIPLRMDGQILVITANRTDHRFFHLKSVDGARFAGKYALSEWNGVIPSITFTADGRFVDEGALRVLYHEYVDCINPALAAGAGTYEIKNFSALFRYADGRRVAIAFLGAEFAANDPSPATLRLSSNQDELRRQ